MPSTMETFSSAAQKLSRNPLGIIALFIVLVYGIAALVLGLASRDLSAAERVPLIWFLVGFPFVVLFVFAWLVSRHHTKLYSPADFRDDEAFIRVLSPSQQRLRLDEKVAATIALAPASSEPLRDTGGVASGVPVRATVRSSIVLGESLVFRELEQEFRSPIRPQVWMQLTDSDVATFDGIIEAKRGRQVLIGVQVKFVRSLLPRPYLERLIHDAAHISLDELREFPLVVAIVTDGLSAAERKSIVRQGTEIIQSAKFRIDLRVYDLSELKEKYGVNEDA